MALAAGIEGAELIPDGAELFLGFTSTQKAGLGPSKIANLETLGYADLGPSGYFAHGTHMHLSHLFEDVAAWYLTFDFQDRLDTTFRPGLDASPETQTVRAEARATRRPRSRFAATTSDTGGSGTRARSSPPLVSTRDVVGADGTRYPKGTAVPQRADFNTLDNPFFWTADAGPRRVLGGACGRASLRRLQPHERRLPAHPARDGRRPARRHPLAVRAGKPRAGASTRSSRRRTARTSSCPPAAHRSFPLSELRG